MKFQAQRQHVVELCLELSRRGYFAGTGGNIMLRLDAAHVAVTPSALDYHAMGAADVCVLRLQDLATVDGERAPSVESGLHAQLLRARPDMGCSIHTHQPVASACALLGRELAVPPALRASLGDAVRIAGYAPSGSGLLAARLARTLRPGGNAYLMRNHGILCCGRDSAAAMQAVDDLETLARGLLAARIAARAAAEPGAAPALQRVSELLTQPPHP
ncbi:class II aldolase/adducin family protein [Roseateles saccharophilus]|uniref:L-fuculose-phosphate aldolase n=1 Tax=Roseateles saccharophilus TaxID=304 RepID=A0A4R3UTL4_ROSSA|nr:class II aldolase/adducin family protein [Roseateles saccharophilus]MDG0832699.1 class II aldolase/adducin family protein [Roseateles saccharophilus]TCU95365.1 L-fuculose-phosphate aldolase [Roseateles saccharophilus]